MSGGTGILVFGRTGQVARELARRAPEAVYLGRDAVDLSDPAACADAVRATRAKAIINAAAWTAVDQAEAERDAAQVVNADAPGAMARAAAESGTPFLHVSTDYVFDGQGNAPFRPEDPTAPLGAYGSTKLAGEEAVRSANGPHLILRTSWVFSAHGTNFVKTMLRLSESRDSLRIVNDQIGGPTSAGRIAEALLVSAERLSAEHRLTGTHHFAGAPDTSWADFARAIFEGAGRDVDVEGIPTAEYPTPAPRPLNSRLDCSAFEAAFGVTRPDWRADLEGVLAELGVGAPNNRGAGAKTE